MLPTQDLSPKDPVNGEKKRKRGATRLSCAECRRYVRFGVYSGPPPTTVPHPPPRLKLRCDRAIPCGSCVKRGCAAICPDGPCLFPHSLLAPFLIGSKPPSAIQAPSPQAREIGTWLPLCRLPLLPHSHLAHPDSSSPPLKTSTKRSISSPIASVNSRMPSAHHTPSTPSSPIPSSQKTSFE